MKHPRLNFFIGVFLFGNILLPIRAAEPTIPTPPPVQPIVLLPGPKPNLRPKAPSRQIVTCIYDEGNLYFEFAIPEGQCQLFLSDPSTGETVVAGFDSDVTEPVYVGYHRTASLTVNTENGNTYAGEW